jgi:glucose-6-phosphate 1-dehydrogenase
MSNADAIVFFGATGDLAFKKIFPALQALVTRGNLNVPIIGVARSLDDLESFRARARASLEANHSFDPQAFAKLSSWLRFVRGDYADEQTFTALRAALAGAKRPLYYLAIPPDSFADVARHLASTGCNNNARVVVEKPFGRDLESAKSLNATLHKCFPEPSIFRIDHYLGKEAVQNLIYFRFANTFLEPIWNRNHVKHVQITMAEHIGIEGRGRFYEEVGAIRDVLQNHLLELVALLTMEEPVSDDHDALRDAKLRAFQAMQPLSPGDVVRGQFEGYRSEPGVAADSAVETFAAVRLCLNSPRWQGVPFYIRAGKRLPVSITEIRVTLDQPGNYVRFRLSPEVIISVGARTKEPGETMTGEDVELLVQHAEAGEMGPYERLIGDAMRGDATLFVREDEVETAWKVVEPILGNVTPLHTYAPDTWGPAEAEKIFLFPPLK